MATKADFTEDEWDALHKGVTGAGLLVSVGDPDFTDTFGEAGALSKRLRQEHEQSSSELVRELAGIRSSGFGLAGRQEKVEAETLEALHTATTAITAKAPGELDPYREFVLGVAQAVAEAKGGVTEKETAVIDKLKGALAEG